jgi:hypothetical protein
MNETGRGRFLLDREKWHDDIRLLAVSRKRRWETDESFREIIVERLRHIITEGDDEIALKAIAEAKHLESQNQRDEHKALDEFSNRVLELAARFGIDATNGGSIEASEVGAIRGNAEAAEADEE